MVDFISEVQEELRKDDYNKWMKRYGPYALGVIVLIIAAAGYMEWDKANTDRLARATSASYLAASDLAEAGNVDGAVASFLRLAEEAPNGYAGLSLMRAGELELNRNNAQTAISLLDRAAGVFENARHQELAQIKAAYILAGEGAYSDVTTRVTPLAEKGRPYEYLARELLGFAAKETGDVSLARQQFSYLNTIPGVPESIQQRAKQYLDLMSVSSAQDRAEATPTPTDETTTDEIETTETPDVP